MKNETVRNEEKYFPWRYRFHPRFSPIVEGGTAAGALQNTLDFARHAERYGYHRYWLAEHHNMPVLRVPRPPS